MRDRGAGTLRALCALLLAAGSAAAAGCGRGADALAHNPVGATLRGRVRLADGAQLPAYAPFDLLRDPLRGGERRARPAECAAALDRARHPVELTPERLLAGVVVAASDFSGHRESEPRAHRVAIRHCRLEPAVIAATAGDTLALENADRVAFEPLIGPAFEARALTPGERVVVPLRGGNVESIRCSRSGPCGRTDVVVFKHPIHAVTDARGQFRIDGFPTSELVRVSAWHPLFEQSDTYVWVEPGKPTSIELVLEPRASFAEQR
jgi:hypothetical protein